MELSTNKSIFGLHPYGHDSAICHFDTAQKEVFAIAYERFTRVKHDSRFSGELFEKYNYDLNGAKICIPLKELNGKRFLYFDFAQEYKSVLAKLKKRKSNLVVALVTLFCKHPNSLMRASFFYFFSDWLRGADNLSKFEKVCRRKLRVQNVEFQYFDHHTAHAASAYYFAPNHFIDESLIVTLDGQGDGYFSKVFTTSNNQLVEMASSNSDFSINLIYSACTSALGFNSNADEGKLEALASYCQNSRESNRLYSTLSRLFIIDENISIRIRAISDFPFKDIRNNTPQIEKWFIENFKDLTKEEIAFGMQSFYEDFILSYIRQARAKFSGANLVVAGGGFANVKLNKRLFESGLFGNFFIFPAMGDDGAALGALALGSLEDECDLSFLRDISMPFFGPSASDIEIRYALEESMYPIKFEEVAHDLPKFLARDLIDGNLCALFQGRMEYGPRALGHRSILANPLLPEIKNELNLKFKKREWFQPFCPSILESELERLFVSAYPNRHMTCAFQLRTEFVDKLPGISHIDGTARAEFLTENEDPIFFATLEEFKRLSGFGVLLNTSFNIHGKTIVLTPKDALDDFMSCSIDVMYIGNFRVTRA